MDRKTISYLDYIMRRRRNGNFAEHYAARRVARAACRVCGLSRRARAYFCFGITHHITFTKTQQGRALLLVRFHLISSFNLSSVGGWLELLTMVPKSAVLSLLAGSRAEESLCGDVHHGTVPEGRPQLIPRPLL